MCCAINKREWGEAEVRAAMQRPLPGMAAQVTMAPRPRPFRPPDGSTPRQAGVLVLLYPVGGRLHLVFTVRTANLDHHAGQVSFPGGGGGEGEAALAGTARRGVPGGPCGGPAGCRGARWTAALRGARATKGCTILWLTGM